MVALTPLELFQVVAAVHPHLQTQTVQTAALVA
jgi:hypothetical protein